MAIVIGVAFSFAALRNADRFWADVTYALAVLSVSAALLGAIVRKGTTRLPWIGYAVFGWTYVLLDLLPPWTPSGFGFERVARPNLMIMWAFGRLKPYVNTSPLLLTYDQVSYSLGMILSGLVGAVLARLLASKNDQSNP
jgi:hypothetical protein